MTALLELKEKLRVLYSRLEVYITPVVKFLLAYVVLNVLNDRMGYMTKLDDKTIVLIAALMCSFLPRGCIILFAALFSLLHMYAISLEVAAVGLVVYLLMFLLFFRFSPKDSVVVVLMPLFCLWKVPYIIPIAAGLLGTPASAVAIGCGIVVYYLLGIVTSNASTISTMESEEATAKVRLIIDGLLDNKVMVVMVAAFAITVIVVYLIRRLSIEHSWTIAMSAGVIINMIVLLVGDVIYETNISVSNALIGNAIALAVAVVLQFFNFCVDYSRTEKVQFEDDEYYYYVKAIPKMTVSAPTKTVKRINTQHKPAEERGRGNYAANRSVVTEKTRGADPGYRRRGNVQASGKTVTIGNQEDDFLDDDYEEL